MDNEVLLQVDRLKKSFNSGRSGLPGLISNAKKKIYAVDDVSFTLKRGEVLGLIGESGCGKSTTARLLMRLLTADSGNLLYKGADITYLKGPALREYRKKAQIVFQDPYEYLNPRLNVLENVAEPLVINKMLRSRTDKIDRVSKCLDDVGLGQTDSVLSRYSHELSGGQRQRVAIARALIMAPELIIADEPTSMLDVSIRAGILNLLLRLKSDLKLSIVFITHDIATAGYMCDNIAVMYKGRVVEYGPTMEIIHNPQHPYTKALINVAVNLDYFLTHKDEFIKDGEVDSHIKSGYCCFKERCVQCCDNCLEHEHAHDHSQMHIGYEMLEVSECHFVACCNCGCNQPINV